MKSINKKFFLLAVFVGVFSIWVNVANAENTVMTLHQCDGESNCKSVCTDGKFTKITVTTGFGGYEYYCNSGYASGKVAIGGTCTKQSDCVDGAYCYDAIGQDKCKKKYAGGENCEGGADCNAGCPGGAGEFYYIEDKYNGGVGDSYICDSVAEKNDKQEKVTPSNLSGSKIPGTTEEGGIIKCGRGGQNMCTLCDMIQGFNNIIQYVMKIAIGVALVAIAIGGILYTVSAGDSGAAEKAKTTIKNALIGFIIVFSAWLIVNTTISAIGARSDLGINVTGWGDFDCNAKKVLKQVPRVTQKKMQKNLIALAYRK